jgi:hypothetical protein
VIIKINSGFTTKLGILTILLINITLNQLRAQERYGITLSNFGGINTATINPSFTVNSKTFLDVNFLTAGLTIENNFVFYHKNDFKFSELLRANPNLPTNEVRGEGLDYSLKYQNLTGLAYVEALGPSFSLNIGKHAGGLFTRTVAASSFVNVPQDLGVLLFEGIRYKPLYGKEISGQKINVDALGWSEIGLNYSYNYLSGYYNNWSVGINIKQLLGYSGAYLSADDLKLNVVNRDTVDITNILANIGYSLPINYGSNGYSRTKPLFLGKGIGLDFGFTFRRNLDFAPMGRVTRYCESYFQPYRYKLGVAVSGLGNIHFNKNTREHTFENRSALWENIDTTEFRNINDFFENLSSVFYGDPHSLPTEEDSMIVGLPTVLNLNADYQYFPNWYLSGMLVLPVKSSDYQLMFPKKALLGIRYETDDLEFNFSSSFFNFQKLHIGFFVRYKYFSIGTSKLESLVKATNLYGINLYFSIKFHLIKGYCLSLPPKHDCGRFQF